MEVNKLARRTRHARIFSKATLLKSYTSGFAKVCLVPAKKAKEAVLDHKIGRFFISAINSVRELIPVSPQKRLLFQGSVIAAIVLIGTTFTPGATYVSASTSYTSSYISEYNFAGDILVNEDGYLVKSNPQTDQSSRIGLTDYAVHTVESGESLSVIAEKYGLTTKTLMWENNIANANSLRVGQTLLVPPVNGISYSVQSGDSLEKIATKYEISADSIIAQNSLEESTLVKGQNLFLPGAEPINPPVIASSDGRAASYTRDTRSYESVESSSAVPAAGVSFIYPTIGSITQGYHAGHYALDIANTSMPPIWAAGGGTVTKASVGTWGGGYGNHVIIDHGNGLQTLYAHMDSVNVYDGQWVNQGDVIGIMGNTGRVYGVTGIHLHWEVILNGVKQYPGDYY